jgi:predicted dehydrogenase
VALIEDCAQAHMTEYKGRLLGTIGDIGCFSFQQSKHMTTGDGGMTITSNKAYHEHMDLFADKGFARKKWGPRAYVFHAPNYRMTELVGAVGLAQLEKVRAVVQRRRELGQHMTELLSAIDGIRPAPVTDGAKHSYWLYPLRLERGDVNQFVERLHKEKVFASAGYTVKPIYLYTESLTAKKTYGDSGCPFTCQHVQGRTYEYKEGLCPRAEATLRQLICIPLDESWTRERVEHTVEAIRRCLAGPGATAAPVIPSQRQLASPPASPAAKNGEKTRIGIVGCGQMGRWHLDAYRRNPHVELVAFADTALDKAEDFAREARGRAYRSHDEMMRNERLDGVSLCTLPATHRAIALDLLDAGIHVLCEKPLAISVAEAREMVAKAQDKKRLLLTAFKFRFFEEVGKAREMIQKGSLGRILHFRLMFGGYMPLADTWYARPDLAGGGIIMDNGPHALDLIRYLLGEIKGISAGAGRYQGTAVEDTAQLAVTLESGSTGTVDLSWCAPVVARSYLEIYGEEGTLLLDLQGLSCRYRMWSDWKRMDNQADTRAAFGRQIDHFVQAIHGGQPSVLGNGEGLKSQFAIDAAYESLRTHGVVAIRQGEERDHVDETEEECRQGPVASTRAQSVRL